LGKRDRNKETGPELTPAAWPADEVESWTLDRLFAYQRNVMEHDEQQVEQIAASMRKFGWTNPILIDENGEIIAGHGRLQAAQSLKYPRAPVIIARGWSEDMKRAYRIADNKLAMNADWNDKNLRAELIALDQADFQLELLGFSDEELKALMPDAPGEPQARGDDDDTPEVEKVAIARRGEVWKLGPHRLMCGDSRQADQVAALMVGRKAHLLHADPPYGLGFHNDGVLNDELKEEDLDRFQLEWWAAVVGQLESNASGYIWGCEEDLWRFWFLLKRQTTVTFRNEIIWDKGSGAMMKAANLTRYVPASERCIFFVLGRHIFQINQTKDDYWEGWEPLRTFLNEQREASGFSAGDIKRICGNHMYGHWFGKSQWAFISRENYEKLARAANGKAFAKPYDELLEQYRALALVFNGDVRDPRVEQFKAGRPFFDNTHDVMRDVWPFGRVTGEERFGHATPKPVQMLERVMRSSLREGDLCLEPFMGTGSTLMAAHRTGRICYGMELEALYVDVTLRRWQKFTGLHATLEGTDETFEEVERARTQAQAVVPSGT
jgi:DNA modification methylase